MLLVTTHIEISHAGSASATKINPVEEVGIVTQCIRRLDPNINIGAQVNALHAAVSDIVPLARTALGALAILQEVQCHGMGLITHVEIGNVGRGAKVNKLKLAQVRLLEPFHEVRHLRV